MYLIGLSDGVVSRYALRLEIYGATFLQRYFGSVGGIVFE